MFGCPGGPLVLPQYPRPLFGLSLAWLEPGSLLVCGGADWTGPTNTCFSWSTRSVTALRRVSNARDTLTTMFYNFPMNVTWLHYITLHYTTLHYITVLRVSGWSSPAYNTLRHLDLSHLTALTSSTSEVEIPSPDLSLPSRSSSLAGLGRAGRQSQKRSLSTSPPAASQSLRRELVTFLIMWRIWHQALDIRY